MLVGGVAVAAAVPSFPFRVFSFPTEIKIAPVAEISVSNYLTVADYADCASFSDFAIAASIDPMLEKVAAQLGYRAGQEVTDLMVHTVYQPEKKYKFFDRGLASRWIAAPVQATA